jgi:hypothetical protein
VMVVVTVLVVVKTTVLRLVRLGVKRLLATRHDAARVVINLLCVRAMKVREGRLQ